MAAMKLFKSLYSKLAFASCTSFQVLWVSFFLVIYDGHRNFLTQLWGGWFRSREHIWEDMNYTIISLIQFFSLWPWILIILILVYKVPINSHWNKLYYTSDKFNFNKIFIKNSNKYMKSLESIPESHIFTQISLLT